MPLCIATSNAPVMAILRIAQEPESNIHRLTILCKAAYLRNPQSLILLNFMHIQYDTFKYTKI